MIESEKENFLSLTINYLVENALTICLYSVLSLSVVGMFKAAYDIHADSVFRNSCGIYLESSIAASTIEAATVQSKKVMSNCREYMDSQGDFWKDNLEQQIKVLQEVSPTTTIQEKSLILQQYREVMKSTQENITVRSWLE